MNKVLPLLVQEAQHHAAEKVVLLASESIEEERRVYFVYATREVDG